MTHIFISYSRVDEDFARMVARSLSDLGADVWIDVEDIPAGMKWSSAIEQGLKACEVMIVIISPEAMASTNVEDEWQYYLDKGKPVIPVLWRPGDIHFQLSRIQYINFHNQNFDRAFRRLYTELIRKGFVLQPISEADNSDLADEPVSVPPTVSRPRSSRGAISTLTIVGFLTVVALSIIGIILASRPPDLSASLTDRTTPTIALSSTFATTGAATSIPSDTLTETSTSTLSLPDIAATTLSAQETQTAEAWTHTPTPTSTVTPDTTSTLGAIFTEAAADSASQRFVTIEPYQVGVVIDTVNGALLEPIRGGVHLIRRRYEVIPYSLLDQELVMAEDEDPAAADGIDARTKDGQSVTFDIVVTFRVDAENVNLLHSSYGGTDYVSNFVRPTVRGSLREIATTYAAEGLYGEDRTQFMRDAEAKIAERLTVQGLEMRGLLVSEIHFSPEFVDSMEAKQRAAMDVARTRFASTATIVTPAFTPTPSQ